MKSFDVIILGGGPGGYVAAIRASQSGFKTAIVEKEAIGGTCLNWGYIPTKCLLHNAKIINTLSMGKAFDFGFDHLEVDYSIAHKRSRKIVKRQTKAVEMLLKKNNISLITGTGRFKTSNEIQIRETDEIIKGKNIIIATGSSPRQLNGISLDGNRILSFRHALDLKEIPESAFIIGAGPIGMEFATIWNQYGATVTVAEMLPAVLPQEDREICGEALKQYKRTGINIFTQAQVTSIKQTESGSEVTISQNGTTHIIEAEIIMVAIGFVPNSKALGLNALGIKVSNGKIDIDENMRTSIPNIFAVGDVTGKLGLAQVASAQGMIAADTIAGKRIKAIDYVYIPRCTYSSPETASVGLTEEQLKNQNTKYEAVKYNFLSNGKALAMEQNRGFVKIITHPESKKILGVHMIGSNVTELISEPANVIHLDKTIHSIADTVHPNPSLSEVLYEAAHLLTGQGIHS